MSGRITLVLASLVVGAGSGLLIGWLSLQETRWIVYATLSMPVGAALLLTSRRSQWLWVMFILSTQIYVSIRVLHGYAGSEGFEFPLMFLLGAAVAASELLDRDASEPTRLRFGGPLSLPIILIFATTGVSLAFTSEQFVGLTALLRLCLFYAMYLVGLNFAASPERIQQTVWLLACVLLMQSLVFGVQAYTGVTFSLTGETFGGRGVRAGGTVGSNSAIYATFVAPIILILAAHVFSATTQARERWLLAVPLVLGVLTTVGTLRRGAWGGLILGGLWLAFFGRLRNVVWSRLLRVGFFALPILLLAAPWVATRVDRLRSDNPLASAFDERMQLMRIAVEVIEKHPIVGVGLGAYPHQFKSIAPPEMFVGWVSTVHNYYLLLAAETGIFGALAFVLFLVFAARLGLDTARLEDPRIKLTALGCSAAVVSYAFAVAWEPLNSFSPNALLWFLVGMIGAARLAAEREPSPRDLQKVQP